MRLAAHTRAREPERPLRAEGLCYAAWGGQPRRVSMREGGTEGVVSRVAHGKDMGSMITSLL